MWNSLPPGLDKEMGVRRGQEKSEREEVDNDKHMTLDANDFRCEFLMITISTSAALPACSVLGICRRLY